MAPLHTTPPATLADFRKNVAALENRAIFEIPEFLAKLLGESSPDAPAPSYPAPQTHVGAGL